MRLAVYLLLLSFAAAGQSAPDNNSKPPPAKTPPAATAAPAIEAVKTTITVTGNVTTETPAAMVVLDQQQLQETPGVNLDDRLRQVPGFSLFRRSSSLAANPTTQGVSLRALGSTGASRTLVLWDGVPLNDPFGGWIYWTRVDPDFVDRVEITQGANSAVFGSDAMGGTVSLFSAPAQKDHALISYFGGNNGTQDLLGGYSTTLGKFGVSAEVHAFTTDGYYLTPRYLRGTVDDRANVRFVTGVLHLDYLGAADRLALRLDTLTEARHNGTVLQTNSTSLGTVSANYTHSWEHDEFAFIGYRTQELFHSTYSAVAASRNFEKLTSRQRVPAQDLGGAAYWNHHATVWNTIVGMDADDAHGTSEDLSYSTGVLTPSGGTILQHGIFGQADAQWKRARFYGGLRQEFTGRGQSLVSPNGGVAVGLGQFRLRASAYRSYRAPTLNELYRQFRVGNALTLANSALIPEQLTGEETGVDFVHGGSRVAVTLFHDDLSNLITNATLSTSPTLILRQRQNVANGRSMGWQAAVTHRWRNWTADANYLYADARVATGPMLPQVPKQQGTGGLTYTRNGTLISAGIRAFSLQFDDDLNQFLLPGFAAVQFAAEQRLTHGLSAQVAVENLLDRQYLVALTPTPNVGAPRLWRIGLRWTGGLH